MASEIHVGDVGTIFEVTIKDGAAIVDISTATVKMFTFKKPSGALVSNPAAFTTDGRDGRLRYVTVANDLDEAGTWKLQICVEMPTGSWHSDELKFTVYKNL